MVLERWFCECLKWLGNQENTMVFTSFWFLVGPASTQCFKWLYLYGGFQFPPLCWSLTGNKFLVGPPPTQCFPLFSPRYWTWQQDERLWRWQQCERVFGNRFLVGPPPTQCLPLFSTRYWTWQQDERLWRWQQCERVFGNRFLVGQPPTSVFLCFLQGIGPGSRMRGSGDGSSVRECLGIGSW